MKAKYLLTIIFFMLINCSSSTSSFDKRLIGIWQTAPVMGAGWNDSYTFYSGEKFVFRINQSICDQRIIGSEGSYSIEGDTLSLIVKSEIVIQGGKLVEAKGSCLSDKEITGGKIVKNKLKVPLRKKLSISSISDDGAFNKLKLEIDNKTYWKHRVNPEDY